MTLESRWRERTCSWFDSEGVDDSLDSDDSDGGEVLVGGLAVFVLGSSVVSFSLILSTLMRFLPSAAS